MISEKKFWKNYDNQGIKEYYDHSYLTYKLFAYNTQSLSIHYGFWDRKTKSIQQAMLNEIKTIISLGNIKKNQRILDAGCGVGGSAIYIAKNKKSHVTGISLSPVQISSAMKHAKACGVRHLTTFIVQDYTRTNFPDNYFDVVYGIESICYAHPKSKFLKEAYRILKPGGKLIIADGYLRKRPQSVEEKNAYYLFRYGMITPPMITAKQMMKVIISSGFCKVQTISKITEVTPSVKYFYYLGLFLRLITTPIRFIHPTIKAMYI